MQTNETDVELYNIFVCISSRKNPKADEGGNA